MARDNDRTPNATAFIAILLTALVMSAVITRAGAQSSRPTTPPSAAEPAAPQNAAPVTPRSEAEAACRAIGNQDQRAQCLAELQRDGAPTLRDTVPPPPAEIKRPELQPPSAEPAKPN